MYQYDLGIGRIYKRTSGAADTPPDFCLRHYKLQALSFHLNRRRRLFQVVESSGTAPSHTEHNVRISYAEIYNLE